MPEFELIIHPDSVGVKLTDKVVGKQWGLYSLRTRNTEREISDIANALMAELRANLESHPLNESHVEGPWLPR